jgi:hypothetical protein
MITSVPSSSSSIAPKVSSSSVMRNSIVSTVTKSTGITRNPAARSTEFVPVGVGIFCESLDEEPAIVEVVCSLGDSVEVGLPISLREVESTRLVCGLGGI